jgi:Asp-tRNA(Asn)/Glu-tRNA(Gln) amidotransferase A subunit family amidase
MDNPYSKSKNKLVKKQVKKLKELGAEIDEVYIDLFNGDVFISFFYDDIKYRILQEDVMDTIQETIIHGHQ